jgi:hypothetical protein
VNGLTRQTLSTVNRNKFFMNILCIESFCPQKESTSEHCSPLKHGRHFDYWNQPLNLRMRFCYLGCQESGLCCYLVIHIGNLLLPVQQCRHC